MIHLHEMRADVERHLNELAQLTDEEIVSDVANHVRQIVEHLERIHRNLAVHIETLG